MVPGGAIAPSNKCMKIKLVGWQAGRQANDGGDDEDDDNRRMDRHIKPGPEAVIGLGLG